MKPYTVIFYIDGDYSVHTFVEHVLANSSADAFDVAVEQAKDTYLDIRSHEWENATGITTFDGHLEHAST